MLISVLATVDAESRGDWLCEQVRQMQVKNNFANVIGFKLGRLSCKTLQDIQHVGYPQGCSDSQRHLGGLGRCVDGCILCYYLEALITVADDLSSEIARTGLTCNMSCTCAGLATIIPMIPYNDCQQFTIAAFDEGEFDREGDGGPSFPQQSKIFPRNFVFQVA